jgi:hypothetical protein
MDAVTARNEEAVELAERIKTFRLEADIFWRDRFMEWDTRYIDGTKYGVYSPGDESAPFFSEALLYNLVGKDDARSILGIVRRLCVLAGVEYR